MQDAETDESAAFAIIRRLRLLAAPEEGEGPARWRDDLRLFAITWAAGFLFFLIVLA